MVVSKRVSESSWFVVSAVASLAAVIGLLWLFLVYFSRYSGSTLEQGSQAAQIVSSFSLVAAALAFIYNGRQLKFAREQQDRNFAEGLYRDYLKLAFENPILAAPKAIGLGARFDYENQMISGTTDSPALLYAKYEWFVSFVLDACEQLYKNGPLRKEYGATVRAQLWYHRDWLRHKWKTKEKGRGAVGLIEDDDFSKLIEQVLAKSEAA